MFRFGIASALTALFAASALGQGREGREGRDRPRGPEIRGVVKAVSAAARTITVTMPQGRENPEAADTTYPVAESAEIAVGSSFARVGVYREAKLGDLPAGVFVSLSLAADKRTVEAVLAEEPTVRGLLKAVDAGKKSLTVAGVERRGEAGEDKVYTLADVAEIAVDDGRGKRFSIREAKATDLAAGSTVTLRLSLDSREVLAVLAEGATVQGTVKAVDAGRKALTLTLRPARGDDAGEERTVTLADDATVLLDDGRSRRLSLKAGKLADAPVGGSATVRLSPDGASAVTVRVEGPSVVGLFKGSDAAKNTITVTLFRSRDDMEQKTYTLAADARVTVDGRDGKLSELKVAENGPFVQLRLGLDGATVQSVNARTGERR